MLRPGYVDAPALAPHTCLVLDCPDEIDDFREFLLDSGSATSVLNTRDSGLARSIQGLRAATNYDGTDVPHLFSSTFDVLLYNNIRSSATKTTHAASLTHNP